MTIQLFFDKSLLYKIFFYYKTNQVPVLQSFFSSASQALHTRSWRPTCHRKARRDIAFDSESCRSRCVHDGCGDRCSKPVPLGSDLPPQHWEAHGHPCRGPTPSALYYLQIINKEFEVIWGWSNFRQDIINKYSRHTLQLNVIRGFFCCGILHCLALDTRASPIEFYSRSLNGSHDINFAAFLQDQNAAGQSSLQKKLTWVYKDFVVVVANSIISIADQDAAMARVDFSWMQAAIVSGSS